MNRETVSQLHARFGRPSLGGAGSARPQSISISLSDLAAESVKYKPGYVEAAMAVSVFDSDSEHRLFHRSALDAIRRQFSSGCCG